MEKQKKTAVVTGSTGAIGSAIARQIASKGYRVILVARHEGKVKRVVREIIGSTQNPEINYEIVDLTSQVEIQNLADRWVGPLHVLVNNAAVTPRSRQESAEGVEMQFATNVLGYFRMTKVFRETLVRSAPARVVDVASYWAGGLDLDDLEFAKRRYTNGAAYRQSKQANRMLAVAWANRMEEEGISVNVCHPGDVNSTLSNNLGFGGAESPDQGAATPAWLATDPMGGKVTGKYFEHFRETRCRYGEDHNGVEALFRICETYS
jgi:NAD(P)-dependent dehydrogenase (short-subunit alcohol dehydrogenase family)